MVCHPRTSERGVASMQDLTPTSEPKIAAKRGKRQTMPEEPSTAVGRVVSAKEQAAHEEVETETMTLAATCRFFGGDRPLNPSTLYRGVRDGQYPPPILLGPNNPRWLRSECLQAIERLK